MLKIMKNIEIKMILVDEIGFDETQARQGDVWYEDEQDNKLEKSIKGFGLIHYLIIRPTNSEKYTGKIKKPYILVAGSRRLNAMIKAGYKEVPCRIIDLTDIEAIAMSYNENIGRKKLSDFQKLTTINTWIKLLVENKKTMNEAIKEIAEICGSSITHIFNLIKSDKLPEEIKNLVKIRNEKTNDDILALKNREVESKIRLNINNLTTIASIFDRLGDIPELTKTGNIFKVINEFDLDRKSVKRNQEILNSIDDKIPKGIDNKRDFDVIIQEVKDEQYKVLSFALPKKYISLHDKIVKLVENTSAQLIRKVYINWLKEKAIEEGWN